MDEAQWHAIDALIAERDPYCRGVVLLGLNAPVDALAKGFRDACASTTCRGFAVGRTVFQEPATKWLAGALDDAGVKRAIRANFETLIDAWREARASASTATGMSSSPHAPPRGEGAERERAGWGSMP
jgi:5-dehydro-2-deoxygluconokinase